MRTATHFLFALLVLTSAATAADENPQFKITTKRDTDKVEVKAEKDNTTFTIHSPVGISQAIIERTAEKWPDAVTIRLNLKGLESFQVTNGKVTLSASVSSNNEKQRVRVWKDGDEKMPLDDKSPFWMEILMIGNDGKPTTDIPLKDGYFEMALPKAFFEGDPKSITLNWIDFYR